MIGVPAIVVPAVIVAMPLTLDETRG